MISSRFKKRIFLHLPEGILAICLFFLSRISNLYFVTISFSWGFPITYKVVDKTSKESLHISRIKRTYKVRNGISNRLEEIREKYFLRHLYLKGESIAQIIDVGANIGEVGIASRLYWPDVELLMMEPESRERLALRKNNPNGTIFDIFLDSVERETLYISKNDSGDSSLISDEELKLLERKKTKFYSPVSGQVVETRTKTLDSLQISPQIHTLLKVEAEGFEPEVLIGSQKTLESIKYVAIDTSPERYVRGTYHSTFENCKEILEKIGFILEAKTYHSALFVKDRN